MITVFISHSTEDAALAVRIVELLRMALNIPGNQIRCSSIAGYGLASGADIDVELRNEVLNAPVLVALLTEVSVRSTFVLFELGARWGTGRPFFPLLAGNYSAELLRKPLNATNALSCGSAAHLHQFVSGIAAVLNRPIDPPATYQRYIEAVVDTFNASSRLQTSNEAQSEPLQATDFGPMTPTVFDITIPVPRCAKAPDADSLEREQSFDAHLVDMRVTEATTVRCRYDWSVEIHNRFQAPRGFFGSVSFRDPNGYDVARHDISIIRPLRVPAAGDETYTFFMYLAPEHARFVVTAELSLVPRALRGSDLSAAITREWNGAWPQ